MKEHVGERSEGFNYLNQGRIDAAVSTLESRYSNRIKQAVTALEMIEQVTPAGNLTEEEIQKIVENHESSRQKYKDRLDELKRVAAALPQVLDHKTELEVSSGWANDFREVTRFISLYHVTNKADGTPFYPDNDSPNNARVGTTYCLLEADQLLMCYHYGEVDEEGVVIPTDKPTRITLSSTQKYEEVLTANEDRRQFENLE